MVVAALHKTADTLRVTEYCPGDLFRIVDPDHSHAGRIGTLEFAVNGAAWLRIKGQDVPVSLSKLILVRKAS